MKKILITLFISTGLSASNTDPTDMQLHLGATYIISSATTAYALNKTNNKKKAMLIGFSTGMAVGITKELIDKRAQNKDVVGNIVGSALGCFVVTIPLR
tara:strand:- start:458 stop:754 length:297 start_codon:yes stop_codon:yes gene_type:complete